MPGVVTDVARPAGAARVGDVRSGGGHGYVIADRVGKQMVWAKGVQEIDGKRYAVWTPSRDEASWWRAYRHADRWAEDNLILRRRPYEITRIQFPKTNPAGPS